MTVLPFSGGEHNEDKRKRMRYVEIIRESNPSLKKDSFCPFQAVSTTKISENVCDTLRLSEEVITPEKGKKNE